jgi:large subunit ribosomal protein L22
MNEAKAILKNLDIAPRKVRLVANLIRGLAVNEALAQLEMSSLRSTGPIKKLVYSAIANAKNAHLDESKLYVKTIYVDKGIMLKRYLPRAQGRATPLQKKRSHITLVLGEKEQKQRFVLHRHGAKPKTAVKPKEEKVGKVKQSEVKEKAEAKPREEKGAKTTRRVFRRKAI